MLLTNGGSRRLLAVGVPTCLLVVLLFVFRHLYSDVAWDPSLLKGSTSSLLGGGTRGSGQGKPPHKLTAEEKAREGRSVRAAGNSTLGFSKIVMINLKHRYDRLDAASLQSYVSGIDFEEYIGVDSKSIDREKPGFPPHSGNMRGNGELACFRSHANIWSQMVRERSPPVLVMENDAIWDVNIRSIMAKFNKNFVEFLREIDSQPVPGPWRQAEVEEGYEGGEVRSDRDDPWLSEHWDIIGLGHCMEHADTIPEGPERKYKDNTVIAGYESNRVKLGKERVIRRSGATACTAAYAISHRGAAKILVRSNLDMNDPIDLIMGKLMEAKDLVSYTITPPVIGQWKYVEGIGMDHAGSDIHAGKAKEDNKEKGKDGKEKPTDGWDKVWKTHSVWRVAGFYGKIIKDSALDAAWERLYSTKAPFTMPSLSDVGVQEYTEMEEKAAPAETKKEGGGQQLKKDEDTSEDNVSPPEATHTIEWN